MLTHYHLLVRLYLRNSKTSSSHVKMQKLDGSVRLPHGAGKVQWMV